MCCSYLFNFTDVAIFPAFFLHFCTWQDQLDALIAQIRTEKYFEAHGIRTPLPAARVAVKEEAEFEFVDDEMVPQLQGDDVRWLLYTLYTMVHFLGEII